MTSQKIEKTPKNDEKYFLLKKHKQSGFN